MKNSLQYHINVIALKNKIDLKYKGFLLII